ncbi:MAG: Glu-tRNA(Gln) amidotransferase subunit GatE [Clostridium sp.]
MENNYLETKKRIGYTPRKETPLETYEDLGLMCGLEVHQQLQTAKKLFCHCPAGRFQRDNKYNAEVIRHMRPTLSEMGGYDGTALMEFKTKKTIVYRIADETTCTYDIDDTPPFKINDEALNIAIEIALLLKTNIVGELHITRKQYLDGSIPAGFQRTAIVSIEGEIPLKSKKVRIIQLSIEEDSCREVSDIGHVRIYTTDRLGMPLIETVTYPDMKTPDEAAEAAQYIRFLNRSTGKIRTGIGAGREDVNVSITGGTRVEIKGVSKISSIPELVHNEAFRQKSLLEIKTNLLSKISDPQNWRSNHIEIHNPSFNISNKSYRLIAINLPGFKNILSFFTQPGRMFADEISDRLKVIACIEKPNMTHSETMNSNINFNHIRTLLNSKEDDAQILCWGPSEDIATALDTIDERCKIAFEGVPSETRKSLENGTTIFERVLPGADRMYPDTDSAPISIDESLINQLQKHLPNHVNNRIQQLRNWKVPEDTYFYLLRNNLVPLIEKINIDLNISPAFTGALLGHNLKHLQGKSKESFINASQTKQFNYERIYELFAFIKEENLNLDIAYSLLPIIFKIPEMDLITALNEISYIKTNKETIIAKIPVLSDRFNKINTSKNPKAKFKWIMNELRKMALGNIPLKELAEILSKEVY